MCGCSINSSGAPLVVLGWAYSKYSQDQHDNIIPEQGLSARSRCISFLSGGALACQSHLRLVPLLIGMQHEAKLRVCILEQQAVRLFLFIQNVVHPLDGSRADAVHVWARDRFVHLWRLNYYERLLRAILGDVARGAGVYDVHVDGSVGSAEGSLELQAQATMMVSQSYATAIAVATSSSARAGTEHQRCISFLRDAAVSLSPAP